MVLLVTSNTSKCVNNMFAEARSVGWQESMNHIVDIMSTRIFQCRTKHVDREPSEVVPRVAQVLKRQWDGAASMSVIELERGNGDFKVVESFSGHEADRDDDDILANMPLRPGGEQSIHIVKPDLQWCTCGRWQDYLYACRHACAVYRKWYEKDFEYVLQNLVHPYYTFEYVQKLYKSNIYPVCVDNINYDGTTKPPVVRGRQPGRPRTKRIRRRSEFLAEDDSPVTCSECGRRGHNKRTCNNQEVVMSL
jgi:hypothetical protein